MSDNSEPVRPSGLADAGRPLAVRIAAMADRLADLVGQVVPSTDGTDRRAFLSAIARQYDEDAQITRGSSAGIDAVMRLTDTFALTASDLDVVVLAALPDEHEGFCHVLRSLNPRGEPRATLALAWRLAPTADAEKLMRVHTVARGGVPVLRVRPGDEPNAPAAFMLSDYPGPMIVCARLGFAAVRGSRAVYPLPVERLRATERYWLWRTVLPELVAEAETLAARYALEPNLAAEVAIDVQARPAAPTS